MRARWIAGSVILTTWAIGSFAACGQSTFESDSADAAAEGATGDEAPSDAAPGDEVTTSGDAAPDSGCGGSHGPDMVAVPATKYCIDSAEVSRAQYQDFIAAIGSGYAVPAAAHCSWNTDFSSPASCLAGVGDAGDLPATCVDWCDAFSFCQWAGKRLCGSTDDGGPLTLAQGSSDESEWVNACDARGTKQYAYSNDFAAGACNDHVGDAGALAVVGETAFPDCVGGYPGIHDLPGNAAEWISACDDDADASDAAAVNCLKIGGSFARSGKIPLGQCTDFAFTNRSQKSPDVGFRCCSDRE